MGSVCIFLAWYFPRLHRPQDLRHSGVPLLCPSHFPQPPPPALPPKARGSSAILPVSQDMAPWGFLRASREVLLPQGLGSRSLSWHGGVRLEEAAPLLRLHFNGICRSRVMCDSRVIAFPVKMGQDGCPCRRFLGPSERRPWIGPSSAGTRGGSGKPAAQPALGQGAVYLESET